MLAIAEAGCLIGIDAHPVQVEVQLGRGLPGIDIVGLPERAVRESRVRVKAALEAIEFVFPPRHLVLNLAPGDLRKTGSAFDLAIAASILAACGSIATQRLKDTLLVGELSLAGELRAVPGVLAQLRSAKRRGLRKALIPPGNAQEASLIDGVDVIVAKHLRDVRAWLNDELHLQALDGSALANPERYTDSDISEIRGQHAAKRALEIAAAGKHHLVLLGSPGAGKTMLARALPSILPDPTPEEFLEIATVQSAAGIEIADRQHVLRRPFRAPHHTASSVALIGGGDPIRPGEVTLAHQGVLFLDELPEFRRDAIETLRTVMEERQVSVARANQRVQMPAAALVIAAMNPCPCGFAGDKKQLCSCAPDQIARYRGRVSGPIVDRFDLQIFVPRTQHKDLRDEKLGDSSAQVRQRVSAARDFLSHSPANTLKELSARCETTGLQLLDFAMDRLGLSARSYVKALRVARTIAALDKRELVRENDIAEAIQYRTLDKKVSA